MFSFRLSLSLSIYSFPSLSPSLPQGRDEVVAAKIEKDVHELGIRGIRSIAVAKTDESGHWKMLGLLTFLDPPRPDTKATIDRYF